MIKAYAEPKNASTNRTADDAAYTAYAERAAAEAGVRNPGAYVRGNVQRYNQGQRTPANRNRVMGGIGRNR